MVGNKLNNFIDIKYDVRKDSNGLDPDKYSNTLRSYHKKLWSKLLPNGKYFDLNNDNKNVYLHHKSELGEYFLSSDSIIHTYYKWPKMKNIVEKMPEEEIAAFLKLACTVGGYIIFPSNNINNLPTINQERGCNKKICDRFDLTLECIRLFFSARIFGEKS